MKHARLAKLRETKFAPVTLESVKLSGLFSGYASLFNIVDLGNDLVMPGAFKKSLQKRNVKDIRMLFQHDPNQPIGVWNKVIEDTKGLYVEGQITTSIPKGNEVLELMRAGALDGLSIGFRTQRSHADPITKARRIVSADLWEISVVTFPMLEAARISSIKSGSLDTETVPSVRQFEKWLTQDAGLTRSQARTLLNKGYSAMAHKQDAVGINTLVTRVRAAANQLSLRN